MILLQPRERSKTQFMFTADINKDLQHVVTKSQHIPNTSVIKMIRQVNEHQRCIRTTSMWPWRCIGFEKRAAAYRTWCTASWKQNSSTSVSLCGRNADADAGLSDETRRLWGPSSNSYTTAGSDHAISVYSTVLTVCEGGVFVPPKWPQSLFSAFSLVRLHGVVPQ